MIYTFTGFSECDKFFVTKSGDHIEIQAITINNESKEGWILFLPVDVELPELRGEATMTFYNPKSDKCTKVIIDGITIDPEPDGSVYNITFSAVFDEKGTPLE